jgi:predicted PurR-regulated permease PerM
MRQRQPPLSSGVMPLLTQLTTTRHKQIASTLTKRLLAAFALLLLIGAIGAREYVSVLVLALCFAVAVVEPTYWFTKTFAKRILTYLVLFVLAALLSSIHWSLRS